MDRFKDFYSQEPNYTRLFLLFVLFLVSLYYYTWVDAYGYYVDNEESSQILNHVALVHTGEVLASKKMHEKN